jgi:hypothetical protein
MSVQTRGALNRRGILAAGAALAAAGPACAAPRRAMMVYKSPTCGCCTAWVDHARRAGFTAEVVDIEDLAPVKRRLGVPDELASCHTVVANGFVFEGHVPLADVQRFLANPIGLGLAVPGMPVGSPGMETPNGSKEPYAVLVFDGGRRSRIYARHG